MQVRGKWEGSPVKVGTTERPKSSEIWRKAQIKGMIEA